MWTDLISPKKGDCALVTAVERNNIGENEDAKANGFLLLSCNTRVFVSTTSAADLLSKNQSKACAISSLHPVSCDMLKLSGAKESHPDSAAAPQNGGRGLETATLSHVLNQEARKGQGSYRAQRGGGSTAGCREGEAEGEGAAGGQHGTGQLRGTRVRGLEKEEEGAVRERYLTA